MNVSVLLVLCHLHIRSVSGSLNSLHIAFVYTFCCAHWLFNLQLQWSKKFTLQANRLSSCSRFVTRFIGFPPLRMSRKVDLYPPFILTTLLYVPPSTLTFIIFCQNISLYEPEQSLSLSQDEGEQC